MPRLLPAPFPQERGGEGAERRDVPGRLPHHEIARLTPAEAAKALVDLAHRVGRLAPMNNRPEKFFEDRSEAEADLLKLARELDPRGAEPRRAPDTKFSTGDVVAGGRLVRVERRGARARSGAGGEQKRVFG